MIINRLHGFDPTHTHLFRFLVISSVSWPSVSRRQFGITSELGSPGRPQKAKTKSVLKRHGLEKELSKDPQLAISKELSWFTRDPKLFQFRGGRLLSNTFPNCTPEFAAALTELVKTGGNTRAEFPLAILQNYEGETSTYVVLKEIVSQCSDDDRKMDKVAIAIDNTGVVSGEFGFVEAWLARKEFLAEWLTDERPAAKKFSEKHIAELNLRSTSEQRRAKARQEMRKRSYDESEELNGDIGNKEPEG